MGNNPRENSTLVELTSAIVTAYVSHNAISAADIGKLIDDVHSAVKATMRPSNSEIDKEQVPAITINRSVTPDYIVCLEDGKRFKSMKQHLRRLGMTPAQYRAKWKLPANYPMVAMNYSTTRSQLAKRSGLGVKVASTAFPDMSVVKSFGAIGTVN